MQENSIAAKIKKKFKRTTNSNNSNYISPNLLEQNFIVNSPNEALIVDITYISTYEGWLYIPVIFDLYSRKVVGWSMNNRMTSQPVVDVMRISCVRGSAGSQVVIRIHKIPVRFTCNCYR